MHKFVSSLVFAALFMLTLAVPTLGADTADANIGLDGPIVGAESGSAQALALLVSSRTTDQATYLQMVVSINKITSTSTSTITRQFGKIADNPMLSTDTEFVVTVCREFAVWDTLYQLIDSMDPPTGFEDIHDEMTEAYRNLSLAGEQYQIGILDMDGNAIRAGTAYIALGTEHLNTATELIKEKKGE